MKNCSRNNAAQLYRLFNATNEINQEDKDAMILYFCDRPYGTLNTTAEKEFSKIYNKLDKGVGYTKGQEISKHSDEEIKKYFKDFAKLAYNSFKPGTLNKYKKLLENIKKSNNE